MKTEHEQVNNKDGNYFITKITGNKTLTPNTYQCYFTKEGETTFLREDEMACAHCRQPIRHGEKNHIMEDKENNPKGRPSREKRVKELLKVEKPYTHVQLHRYETDKPEKYMRSIKTDDLTGVDLEYYKEYEEIRPHRKIKEKKAPLLGTRTTQNHIYCSECYPMIKAAKEL